jgi:hypothetical protein
VFENARGGCHCHRKPPLDLGLSGEVLRHFVFLPAAVQGANRRLKQFQGRGIGMVPFGVKFRKVADLEHFHKYCSHAAGEEQGSGLFGFGLRFSPVTGFIGTCAFAKGR